MQLRSHNITEAGQWRDRVVLLLSSLPIAANLGVGGQGSQFVVAVSHSRLAAMYKDPFTVSPNSTVRVDLANPRLLFGLSLILYLHKTP
jgi:hypothetical protein